jgi:hypothetical protein
MEEKEDLKKEFIEKVEAYLYEVLYFDAYGIVSGYVTNDEVVTKYVIWMEDNL